jgi:hypothetical protein
VPPRRLVELLGAPCRVRDVRVGEVTGVVVDGAGGRVVGLDIGSAGGVHRFLPWVACEVDCEGRVDVRSAFLLVDDTQSYRRLGARDIVDAEVLARLRVDASGRVSRGEDAVSTDGVLGIRQR